MTDKRNAAHALRYIKAIEGGATGDTLAAFYAPGVVVTEMPNRFKPTGAVSRLPEILSAAAHGQALVREQHYGVRSVTADGDRVVLELDWSGVLAVPVGPLTAGTAMKDHVAIFLEYRDGRIAQQRTYDCYEPF